MLFTNVCEVCCIHFLIFRTKWKACCFFMLSWDFGLTSTAYPTSESSGVIVTSSVVKIFVNFFSIETNHWDIHHPCIFFPLRIILQFSHCLQQNEVHKHRKNLLVKHFKHVEINLQIVKIHFGEL